MSKVGEAYVEFIANTTKFKQDINADVKKPLDETKDKAKEAEKAITSSFSKAGDSLKQFGASTTAAGKNLSLKLTAPILAVGGAAFKMSIDFESSMSKIVGLVGIAADEVQAWEGQVKDLAGTYGKSAGEAADALFFITSAGLRGADATNTLEAALKASAVGLGDVTTIADLATSAMNAYGSAVLPASAATDVMVAAVREGKLEASELAGSMGKVLPIASAMGVRFDEVGATFAALSRTGTGASEAATQLRGILGALLKPTADAEKQLSELGLTSSGLRQQIGEQGLFATLQTLTKAFGDNETAQARVFGNVRALAGVMDLMGANVATTETIFRNMTTTTGDLDKAFEVTSETTGFKLQQAFAQTKIALMEFGDMIAPTIARVADAIKSLTSRFTEMDDGTKKIILGVGLLLAAIGPGLLIVGKFASIFGTLFKVIGFTTQVVNAMTGATVASTAATKIAAVITGTWSKAVMLLNAAWAANPIMMTVIAIGALIAGIVLAYQRFEKFRIIVNTVVNFVIGYFEFMANMWIKVINGIVDGVNKFSGIFRKVGINVQELGRIGEISLGRLNTASTKAAGGVNKLSKEAVAAIRAAYGLDTAVEETEETFTGFTDTTGGAGDALEKAAEKAKKLRDTLKDSFKTAVDEAGKMLEKAREGFDKYSESVGNAITKVFSFGDAMKSATDANKTLTDAVNKQAKAEENLAKVRDENDKKAKEAEKKGLAIQKKIDAERAKGEESDVELIAELIAELEELRVETAESAASRLKEANDELTKSMNDVAKAQTQPLSFFDSLEAQAVKARDFGVLVNRLIAGGLSQEALQQVLDAGIDAGSAIATELLDSADGILKANTLVAEMTTLGTSIGTNAAVTFKQAGVDVAKALVDGIDSIVKNYQIKLKSKKLTAKQLKKLQKNFDVEVGFSFEKAGIPALANGAIVNGRQLSMIGEAGPEAVIPISRPARALQLMEQSGLAALARGNSSSAVNIENATFVAPIDADLIAQKVLMAEKARSFAG